MKEPDIVEELEGWITADNRVISHDWVQRAKDEIVNLRAVAQAYERRALDAEKKCWTVRSEALSEAAEICDRANPLGVSFGNLIRSLRDGR